MGWWAEHKAKKASEALAAWQSRLDVLDQYLELAKTWYGYENPDPSYTNGLVLHSGEALYYAITGAPLIEPRRGAGHYEGGSSGFSFHVMKGVTYRVGQQRGTYVQGPENETIIDQGTLAILSTRVVFVGQKQSREWDFAKLNGYVHMTDAPFTTLSVSNRQKVSGFGYAANDAENVHFRLDLALTAYNKNRQSLIAELEQQRAQYLTTKPSAPEVTS